MLHGSRRHRSSSRSRSRSGSRYALEKERESGRERQSAALAPNPYSILAAVRRAATSSTPRRQLRPLPRKACDSLQVWDVDHTAGRYAHGGSLLDEGSPVCRRRHVG